MDVLMLQAVFQIALKMKNDAEMRRAGKDS